MSCEGDMSSARKSDWSGCDSCYSTNIAYDSIVCSAGPKASIGYGVVADMMIVVGKSAPGTPVVSVEPEWEPTLECMTVGPVLV